MDIDIDFLHRDSALSLFTHVVASREENNKLVKHNSGVYLHTVPVNAPTGLCAIPYKEADKAGLFKIDFLNASLYNGVIDEAHLVRLMNKEPIWELLEQDDFIKLLFHVNGHGDILRQTQPKSIDQLAAVLAMIRPAKRYLVGKDWDTINKEVWVKPTDDSYFFKRSHSIAYAAAIVVQMNLICEPTD